MPIAPMPPSQDLGIDRHARGSGLGSSAAGLSFVGLGTSIIPYLSFIGIPLSIIAIGLGIAARRSNSGVVAMSVGVVALAIAVTVSVLTVDLTLELLRHLGCTPSSQRVCPNN